MLPFPSAVRDASRLQARRARNPKRMGMAPSPALRSWTENCQFEFWSIAGQRAVATCRCSCGCQSRPYPCGCTSDREDAAEQGTHFPLDLSAQIRPSTVSQLETAAIARHVRFSSVTTSLPIESAELNLICPKSCAKYQTLQTGGDVQSRDLGTARARVEKSGG